MPRRSLSNSDKALRDTPSAFAPSVTLNPSGSMHSCPASAPMRLRAGHRNLAAEASIYAAATVASLQELCAAVRNCRCVGRLIKCRHASSWQLFAETRSVKLRQSLVEVIGEKRHAKQIGGCTLIMSLPHAIRPNRRSCHRRAQAMPARRDRFVRPRSRLR
jgi:hypothetical protein